MPKKSDNYSPTRRIEYSGKNYHNEKNFFKAPRSPILDVTEESGPTRTIPSFSAIKHYMNLYGFSRYTDMHTHPFYDKQREAGVTSIPSENDFWTFILDNNKKTMVVAEQNPDTGKVRGYYFFRKTKKTPASTIKDFEEFFKKAEKDPEYRKKTRENNPFYDQVEENLDTFWRKAFSSSSTPEDAQNALDIMSQKYSLKSRYVPTRGHEYREGIGFYKKEKKQKTRKIKGKQKGLEKIVISSIFIISSIALIIGLVISSLNITGFVINNSYILSNWSGGLLIILGIIGIIYSFHKSAKQGINNAIITGK